MAKSLSAIMSQIERLQQQAAAIQSQVIAGIRKDIAKYGLTAEQLFGTAPTKATRSAKGAPKPSKPAKPPKYADEAGNTWGGMGKRPDWLRQALAEGKSLDEFLIAKPVITTPEKPKRAGAPAKRRASPQPTVEAKKGATSKGVGKRTSRAKPPAAKQSA